MKARDLLGDVKGFFFVIIIMLIIIDSVIFSAWQATLHM